MASCYASNMKLPVYILVILFGMGSWIAVNGLWVELPILVHEAPEGWNLPSYITILIQVANIAPLVYTLVNKCAPKRFNEIHGVYIIVLVGTVACLMLVFLWKKTAYIAGAEHSVGFLVAVLLLSSVDCTSSVVFLPYMAMLKQEYMTGFYIGEGMSGLVPAVVALGQNVGETLCLNQTVNETTHETKVISQYVQPHFPVEDFFWFLFAMMILCGTAFTLLHFLPYCKREHVPKLAYSVDNDTGYSPVDTKHRIDTGLEIATGEELSHSSEPIITSTRVPMSSKEFITLLVLIGIINGISNGVIPSVSSYSTLPYGDTAFHLSATLMNIVNPCACVVAFFVPVASIRIFSGLVFIASALAAYILAIAAQSPTPPMVGEASGAVLIVSTRK